MASDVVFPNESTIIERTRDDIRKVLPELDPGKEQSMIRAIGDSNSGRSHDISLIQKQLLDQAFPQTATGESQENWAGYNNLQRAVAQPSLGNMVIGGTPATNIPFGTAFTSVEGNQYSTQSAVVLSAISQVLLSANADVSKVVTCTTTDPHKLATGVEATFTNLLFGANTADTPVTIVDANTFTFVASGVTTTGDVLDTGGQYAFDGAPVEVESDDTGTIQNAVSGTVLSIVTPIAGVDADGFVDFSALKGGTDIETEESLRTRTLDRRANPVANFNVGAVELLITDAVPAVSRIHILRAFPSAGFATIFFFVSDTASGIPNAAQVAEVLAAVLVEIPITNDPDDIFVSAPNTVPVAHVIDALAPTDQTLKDAVTANLQAFYQDTVEYGASVTTKQIENVIQNSQDLTTGNFPSNFTLVTPAATTVIAVDEIATFDSASYT